MKAIVTSAIIATVALTAVSVFTKDVQPIGSEKMETINAVYEAHK